MGIEMYQSGVLGPRQIVDYSGTVMQCYPPEAVQRESFIGFKVLLRDRAAASQHPRMRLEAIDRLLCQILPGTGCIVREASVEEVPDKSGLWLITMPVPHSQLMMQIMNMMNVLQKLEQFSIVIGGQYEINVSGRCNPMETETRLGNVYVPPEYMNFIINPINSPYKYGIIKRISEQFMCYRTRWNFGMKPILEVQKDLILLSNLFSTMYH
jgi:hypothetical protein